MDTFFLIAGKSTAFVGSFALMGALIDTAMRKHERERLKDWLIGWWIKFDGMKLRAFGKTEARLVVDYIDAHAGRRLWSRKRWTFVRRVVTWCAVLAILWTVIQLAQSMGARAGAPGDAQPLEAAHLLAIGLLVFAFGVSVSLTRAIAVATAALCTNPLTTVLAFSALLVLHVAILLVWTEGGLQAVLGFGFTFAGSLAAADPPFSAAAVAESAGTALRASLAYLHGYAGRVLHGDFRGIWPGLLAAHPVTPQNAVYTALGVLVELLDLVANGARILFALAFLGSFLMPRLLKDLASRLWEGMIESDRPVFTILLGLIGFVALIGYAVVREL